MDSIYFVGLQRSGHHAIIHWFCNQIDRRVIYYNDIRIDDIIKNGKFNYNYIHGRHETIENKEPIIYNKNKGNDLIIYSTERYDINKAKEVRKYLKNPKMVLILRDYYNQLASHLKRLNNKKTINDKRIKNKKQKFENLLIKLYKYHWINFVNEFLNKEYISDILPIKYNNWFKDNNYKKWICKELRTEFKEDNKELSIYGIGSSFSNDKYKNNPNKLDVLNRYKKFIDNKKFWNYITNKHKELNQKIFGWSL